MATMGRSLSLPSQEHSNPLLGRRGSMINIKGKNQMMPLGRRMTFRDQGSNGEGANADSEQFMHHCLAKVMVSDDMAKGGLHRRVSMLAGHMVGENSVTKMDDEDDGAKDGLQTNGEAAVNLLNNCLGSGLLGISFAIMEGGLLVSLGIIVFAVLVNKFTVLLNLKTCQMCQVDPATTQVGERAFGKPGQIVMVIMYTFLGFFCMVSYISASADCLLGLMSLVMSSVPGKPMVMFGVWAILLVPPTMMRSMKAIATLSFVAFMGGLVMVVALVFCCVQIIYHKGLGETLETVQWMPQDPSKLATAGPLLCLCFAIQAGGGAVLSTMKDTSEENIRQVTNKAFATVFVMDCAVGIIAYLAFQSATKGDVIANLPTGNPVTALAQVCLLDLVVLSYMIMAIPCKLSILDSVFGKNEALNEATVCQFYSVTFVINICAMLFALAVPDLSLINGLNGAICTNMNAFIMPAAFYIVIRSRPEDDSFEPVPISSRSNLPYFLLIIFGTCQMSLGTYQVVGKLMGGS